MVKVTINGIATEVPAGITILQATELLNVEVPVFCYHPRLSIAGNCRMCLVEVENSPKPVASCAMPVSEGMIIHTNTPKIEKARQGTLEFLLINHPLDCPICDQGGECDLQDITMAYGFDHSRYKENKRAVKDKYLGPLIKTVMTRCIHCTRCVRFATEIAGSHELGAIGRGEHMEITSYLEHALTSELSGNMIDICPVGALTSKPYAFTARSWELTKTESIDVLDAVGSNIRVDSRGSEVMRILPRLHEDINEEWISDKTRFAYDGLKRQRLDRPYVRDQQGRLIAVSWQEAFDAIKAAIRSTTPQRIGAIVGDLVDCESMTVLKDLFTALESPHLDCRQDSTKLRATPRCSYLFNTSIARIEEADACLFIGTNPRLEAPLINARFRKRFVHQGLTVGVIGEKNLNLTYPYEYLGDSPTLLKEIADGNHPFFKTLTKANRPLLMIGQGALRRLDGAAILTQGRAIAEACGLIRDDWNGFNVLHTAAARVGGLELSIVPPPHGYTVEGMIKASNEDALDILYLLGADEIDLSRLGPKTLVIYQGHHGDAGASRADVILPGAAYTEKNATYVNTEGRPQRTQRAVSPPGEAQEDWAIIRTLAEIIGVKIPYDTLEGVRLRMTQVNEIFAAPDRIIPASWHTFGEIDSIEDIPLKRGIENFYMTDAITRHSMVMAECCKIKEKI